MKNYILNTELVDKRIISKFHLASQLKAWMDGATYKKYLKLTFTDNTTLTIIIIDNCPGHLTEENRKTMELLDNVVFLLLPKNATSEFQPLDAGYNGVLKYLCRNFTGIRLNNEVAMKNLGIKHDHLFTLERNINQAITFMNLISPMTIQNSFLKTFKNLYRHLKIPFPNLDEKIKERQKE